MSQIGLSKFVIIMTRTQPDPLLKKKNSLPNPTHQVLKIDPT